MGRRDARSEEKGVTIKLGVCCAYMDRCAELRYVLGVGWVGWGGRKAQERGGICILLADSRCCMAETQQHNIVKQLSSN